MAKTFSDNPYTLVFDRLWKLAEDSVALTQLVKLGNRIKHNENELKHQKESVQHADVPELQLMFNSIVMNAFESTSTTKVVMNWDWMLSSGSFRANFDYMQVKFALDAAMTRWCNPGGLTELLWKSKKFCTHWQHATSTIGVSIDENNRSIIGWSSIDSFIVELHLASVDLQTFGFIEEPLETQGDLPIETQQGDTITVQPNAIP